MSNDNEAARAKIRLGIKFLNRHYGLVPWQHYIDTDKLDVGYSDLCPLGQLSGNYDRAVHEWAGFPLNKKSVACRLWAERRGFNAGSNTKQAVLTGLWQEYLDAYVEGWDDEW